MPPPIARDTSDRHVPSRGHCYLYVFPCAWEDHCKLGFSRDPLSRMQALHRRWFEFFDLDRGLLVETETVRDARDLELELRRPLAEHNAPAPMTVRREAAGPYRVVPRRIRRAGAGRRRAATARPCRACAAARVAAPALLASAATSCMRGRRRNCRRMNSMAWSGRTPAQRLVRDALDACDALAIDLEPLLPPQVYRWYRGTRQ